MIDFSVFRRFWIEVKYKFYGIKNIFIWIPVLLEDRQWDHSFLLVILRKKLSLMEKFFRTKGNHVGAEKDADNIKTAICLLDRLLKDDYMESAFVPHKKKYGESTMVWEEIPDMPKSVKMDIKYENQPVTEEEKKKERELFLRCMNKEDYLRKQDLTYLFKHLEKHLFGWWD